MLISGTVSPTFQPYFCARPLPSTQASRCLANSPYSPSTIETSG
jgi:hypothetical protein